MLPADASRESLPRFLEPMLLSTGTPAAVEDGAWAVEVKFDGIRAQLRVDGARGWSVRSRPGRECSEQFPELAALADTVAHPGDPRRRTRTPGRRRTPRLRAPTPPPHRR